MSFQEWSMAYELPIKLVKDFWKEDYKIIIKILEDEIYE